MTDNKCSNGNYLEAREQLARAHAAIHWFARVRAAVTSGMFEGDVLTHINLLAIAHIVSEIWLGGERVTAKAVAETLGWYANYGERAVGIYIMALQEKPYPPFIDGDGQPNIEVDDRRPL
jgi:hypothetical protein